MANFLRPFHYISTTELLSMLLMSKISSYPSLIKNSDLLVGMGSKVIGIDAMSYYMGLTTGRVFSAGESLPALKRTLETLKSINQGSIIDYCAEGETSESSMDQTVSLIESAIKLASNFPNPSVAIKITSIMPSETLKKCNSLQLALTSSTSPWSNNIFQDISTQKLLSLSFTLEESVHIQNSVERARRLCNISQQCDSKIMIDAEQTYFQTAIDALTAKMQEEFNHEKGLVINTVQSYLKDSEKKLSSYFVWSEEKKLKTGVKLVRGAYMKEENRIANGESPVHGNKEGTDSCYNRNLELALEKHTKNSSLCVATHNDESIEKCKQIMWENQIHRQFGGVTFAQLLGMKTAMSFYLVNENYTVQKYTPFGPFNKLIPYLIRRAHEQSAMISDMYTQIDLITQELHFRNSLNS